AMRAQFTNEDADLLDGELVRVVLIAGEAQTVLTIPQRGVQRDLQGAFVMAVTTENVVEIRRVEVDRIVDGLAVINSGLKEGDLVITDGTRKRRRVCGGATRCFAGWARPRRVWPDGCSRMGGARWHGS
ncbi:MAG: hypothetical protein AAGP08_17975, partial [Pseudomonadota bacterium]